MSELVVLSLAPQKHYKNVMDNFVVYAYCREDGTFYYIGKGRPGRPYAKRRRGINPPANRDRILILHSGLSEQTAFDYEEKLILFYGRKDLGTGFLRNMTNGGEGVSGWIPGEEWKRNLSKRRKGWIPSEKWRKRKSESMQGEGNPMYKDGSSLRRVGKPRESMSGENNPMYGKERPDLVLRNKENPAAKGTRWFNNGEIDKRFVPGTEPEGFVQGRLLMAELNSRESSLEALKKSRSQVWESTIDGFRGNAANVSKHNRAKGWDPDARVKVK